ncbi:methylglyoxal synthase [Halogeometricum pallidum JCM 14848]|uniref:Methylglyoxal synthase n=1 Tax=Halogeometricum pallidum JCM 14848 TaxID=1227487 RepID=M0CXG8_HALPD|nr:methylglyoxal synthase [Halogeometricum pallidum]ELZ27333.1 methylglyoxal synthase [Halogeometricum pallidum JCM 14848]
MRLALIAHDEKKPDLIDFAENRSDDLEHFELMATGTTGKRLIEATGLDIERKQSGPLGGDMQIGAEIASEDCHGVVFLRDPLTAQPHEPDITALLRICDVHDVPLATNLASADAVLDELMDQLEGEFDHRD